MAQISIETIQEDLCADGWKLISETYTNLKTEMEFQCPQRHKVWSTWQKMRKNKKCPICEANRFKDSKPIIYPKTSKQRILALDQASHITGWAVFDGRELVQYGTYTVKEKDEFERFHELNEWFVSMLQNWQPDLVGIEGIQYQQMVGITTFQTLARLQGIIAETCIQFKTTFKICPTNTWRAHCEVKGRSRADKKRSMQMLIKQWYDVSVSDDCADAIGIGKYLAQTHSQQIEVINWE